MTRSSALTVTTSFVALLLFSGCASQIRYLPEGKTYGDIVVGMPRVSTRERLINDRLEEEAWLQSQLRETDSKQFGVQGKSDVRTFRGITARAGVNANSRAVALAREANDQALEDARRQRELKSLDYQIALLKKQKDLADAGSNPGAASSSYYPGTPVTPSATTASTPSVSEKVTEALKQQSAMIDALGKQLDLAGRDATRRSDPQDATVSASPIDEFRDRLAYREEIRSEIIQSALDDSHDLAQNTLYRLSFDTTILPGPDTSAWAVIGLTMSLPDKVEEWLPAPDQFAQLVQKRIDKEAEEYAVAVSSRCSSAVTEPDWSKCIQQLPSEATVQLMTLATQVSQVRGENYSEAILLTASQKIRSMPKFRISSPRRTGAPGLSSDEASKLVRRLHDLSGSKDETKNMLASVSSIAKGAYEAIREGLLIQMANGDDFVPDSKANTCRVNKDKRLLGFGFTAENPQISVSDRKVASITVEREMLGRSIGMTDPWLSSAGGPSPCVPGYTEKNKTTMHEETIRRMHAYGATPKETVQRVSEVLARREANEFSLAMQALTGSASVDALLSYMSVNDALFHALRRQPLVVGFSGDIPQLRDTKAPVQFGWIIGPKYEIRAEGKDQAAGFRHVPIQNGVTGIVSVPSYLSSIKLTATTCWRGVSDTWGKEVGSPPCKTTNHIVPLPADPMRAFSLWPEFGKRRIAMSPSNPGEYRVAAGAPATLLIRGENLWRNTKVMIGGQEADRVSVLPDMGGILAHFSTVRPGVIGGENGSKGVDLTIATSEDFVRVAKVLIETTTKENSVAWSVDGPRLVRPGGKLTVKANSGLPEGFNDIIFRSTNQEKQAKAVMVSGSDINIVEQTVSGVVQSPEPAFQGWGSGDRALLVVEVKRFPNDNDPQKQVLGSIVYYATEADSYATLAVTGKEPTKRKAKFTLPVRYGESYPALLKSAMVTMTVTWNEKNGDPGKPIDVSCRLGGKNARECNIGISIVADAVVKDVVISGGGLAVPSVKFTDK
jgi:hypothetical protein